MIKCVIVRYDEIGIKGPGSRPLFEKVLTNNIRLNALSKGDKLLLIGPRIIVYTKKPDAAAEKICKVFGVSSASPAAEILPSLDEIKKASLKFYTKGKFRVSCQRVDKMFSMKSMDVNIEVGSYIVEKTGAKVDLKNYDANIGIELFNRKAYIFNEITRGFGGLPVGSEGKVLAVLEDEDSVLAALMVMNRGCLPVSTGSKKMFNLLKKKSAIKSLEFSTKASGYIAVVSGKTLKDAVTFIKDKEEYRAPVFYPILAVNKSDWAKKYSLY